MGLDDQVLLVVSVVEGRRFPKRLKHKLLVEAKFDNEILQTDPIDHVESPEFGTELAWELSKKSLHQHRLQRTPVKLQCFAIDTTQNLKEPVGYVILDLRSAHQRPEKPQWYPLLSSKYQRMKPEIRLMLALEDDSHGKEDAPMPAGFTARNAPRRTPNKNLPAPKGGPAPALLNVDVTQLKLILSDEDGFFLLGPSSPLNCIFNISVTIGFASNLAKLVPSSFPLSDAGFNFYYNLLGNDVTNEPFFDLLQPNFPAERASVRICTQLEILKLYLENQPGIEVHLCCGEKSLGKALVSWHGLVPPEQTQLDIPSVIEGVFPLHPPGMRGGTSPGDGNPGVGVSLCLKKEKPDVIPVPLGGMSPVLAGGGGGRRPTEKGEKAQAGNQERKAGTKTKAPKEVRQTEADDTIENATELSADDIHTTPQPKKQPRPVHKPATHSPPVKDPGIRGPSSSSPPHHFCCSIDLRSLRDLDVSSAVNVFLRYVYPFFGSSAPVMTSPAVEVQRHTEVLLPKSFCAFDFAATPFLLSDTFTRVPLVIEVYHRDTMARDVLLGVAHVSLAHILTAEKTVVETHQAKGYRQIYSEKVAIYPPKEGLSRRVGELHVVVGLEDFGPVKPQQLPPSDSSQSCTTSSSQAPVNPREPAVVDPRQTAEYHAAVELEMWKEQQADQFQNQLQARESAHMRTLAEEWKRRDKEREVMVRKKIEEYKLLEEKLKVSISDLEKREKQLALNEAEVFRLREELQREHEKNLTDMKEAARRMKEDCVHQVEMERAKVRDLEQQKARLVEQVHQAELRYKDKENEFIEYKERQTTRPEVKLEADLNIIKLEKVELERKLDAANKSKVHYKQQWGRALRELARLKQNEQAAAKARLKKQERELEHMRLRYLASEEKVVQSDRQELEELKNEITKIKELKTQDEPQQSMSAESHKENRPPHKGGMYPLTAHALPEAEESADSRIAKLIVERDTLLQTGVYSTDDRIIMELDRQIREVIASKGS